jgi:hypothetical protein
MRRVVACLVKVGPSRLLSTAAVYAIAHPVSRCSPRLRFHLWLYLPCLVRAQSKYFPMGVGTGVSSTTITTYLMCRIPTSHLRKMVPKRLIIQLLPLPLLKPDGSRAPLKGLKSWSHPHQPVRHPCYYTIVRRKDARTTKLTRQSVVVILRALLASLSVLTLLTFLDVLPSVDQRHWRSSQDQGVLSSQNPQMSTWTSL